VSDVPLELSESSGSDDGPASDDDAMEPAA